MIGKKVAYWADIEEMVADLTHQIKQSGQEFNAILCLARGGLVPAALLAHALDIRNVYSVAVTSYYNKSQFEPELKSDLPDIPSDKLLIVDDLVDTGKTVDFIARNYKNAKVACLFAKPEGRDRADFVSETVSQDTWINFPWEEDKKADDRCKKMAS